MCDAHDTANTPDDGSAHFALIFKRTIRSFLHGLTLSRHHPVAWPPCQRATGLSTQTQRVTLKQSPAGLQGTVYCYYYCRCEPFTKPCSPPGACVNAGSIQGVIFSCNLPEMFLFLALRSLSHILSLVISRKKCSISRYLATILLGDTLKKIRKAAR